MSNAIRLSVLSSFTARCRCCVVYPSKHRAIPIAAHPRRVRHPHRRTRSLHGRSALPFPRIAPLRASTNDTGLAARSGRVCKAVKFPPGYDDTEKLFPCGFQPDVDPKTEVVAFGVQGSVGTLRNRRIYAFSLIHFLLVQSNKAARGAQYDSL